jgi:hypothetical protein
MAKRNGQASLLEPLIPLFAPYCGGVAYQGYLEPAVAQLCRASGRGSGPSPTAAATALC